MTLRRATVAIHALLAVTLGVACAWLLWISLSYQPTTPWPVGPDFIAVPMALGTAVVIAFLALALRSWVRSGDRVALGIADVLAAGTLLVIAIALPSAVTLAAFAVLVAAGATVAANRPKAPHDPSDALAAHN